MTPVFMETTNRYLTMFNTNRYITAMHKTWLKKCGKILKQLPDSGDALGRIAHLTHILRILHGVGA